VYKQTTHGNKTLVKQKPKLFLKHIQKKNLAEVAFWETMGNLTIKWRQKFANPAHQSSSLPCGVTKHHVSLQVAPGGRRIFANWTRKRPLASVRHVMPLHFRYIDG
jgi:hypothetical protein